MSYVIRSKTLSKAQALLRDLRANTSNPEHYESAIDLNWDSRLKEILENWIIVMEPNKDETEVARQKRSS